MITIKKSLNNSMLLVDHDQREMILFGKGIGFGAKPGTHIDLAQVEKVFLPLSDLKSRHFLSLTDTIPAAYFDVSHEILTLARSLCGEKLNSVLLFTLAEHLHFAVERSRNGQLILNKLSWEVKRYYPQEYRVGMQARDNVNERFDVELPEEEAVNIAFHLINASSQDDNSSAHQQVELVNRIAEIVRYKLSKAIDTESVNYRRFITHLRYFAERVLSGSVVVSETEDFYQELMRHRPDAMTVAWVIRDYVQEKYQLTLPKDELTWLSIHISRLMDGHA
ncbi:MULTISPECIES: PRD domain-containing protein [Lelliottia]|uniref:PRD domain-containing protein n=1 Tax=Lelliottia nimipressuralis TaxID=69220 RepID=A0ABD4KE05_9ENTR|nr:MULTISPECIES: PRD domain-containing protein [Lelliottia]MDH6630763.1 beta-glucoside operon transcriptional antiterminator [Lelliottia amnigena]PKA30113.1 transcription antiterminator BglG [Cedecea lapagei]QMM54728.1 PRD domain-containing protein [Enterobacter sp. RHB15-C17]MBF4180152.1 PRD domain-containing protein [Lelliottia nimipressuralis]MCD4558583.1 PRD domain-containing protein [Lelliottia nimipressuralis]